MRGRATSAVIVAAVLSTMCAGAVRTIDIDPAAKAPGIEELWVDPGAEPRDLFWGIGGRSLAPPAEAVYKVEAKDDTGFSVSFDVVGPDKTEWSAKIGPEAQTEVVLSRILWGVGYHQPPIYYLPSWKTEADGGTRQESEARFRPKLARLVNTKAAWKWRENPFAETPQLKGLLVILLMMNSTDLKDDNNSVYTTADAWGGATRWFVVRDLGASLGETGKLFPRRNWIDGFEKQGFITRIEGRVVEFDYDGRHQELIATLTPADVQWGAARLQRLTDAQWRDAFRAANYAEPIADRFIRRIKQKIDAGVALRPDPTDAHPTTR